MFPSPVFGRRARDEGGRASSDDFGLKGARVLDFPLIAPLIRMQSKKFRRELALTLSLLEVPTVNRGT